MTSAIIIGLVALLAAKELVDYLRKYDCEERIRARENEIKRDIGARVKQAQETYRDAYTRGWDDGYLDGMVAKGKRK